MYLQSKKLSVSFKLILVVFCAFGLLLSFGVFDGRFKLESLRFFTVLSNLLCFLYFLFDLFYLKKYFHDENKVTWNPILKGITTMSITVTLLVAHFLLGARFEMRTTMGISFLLLHYIVPIMTILDWLLFDKKGYIKKESPLVWTLGPLVYFLVID